MKLQIDDQATFEQSLEQRLRLHIRQAERSRRTRRVNIWCAVGTSVVLAVAVRAVYLWWSR